MLLLMHEKALSLGPFGLLEIPSPVFFNLLAATRINNLCWATNTGKLGSAGPIECTGSTDYSYKRSALTTRFFKHLLKLLWTANEQFTNIDEVSNPSNKLVCYSCYLTLCGLRVILRDIYIFLMEDRSNNVDWLLFHLNGPVRKRMPQKVRFDNNSVSTCCLKA